MIQNVEELLVGASSEKLRSMRRDALEAYLAALKAVHPGDAVKRWVHRSGEGLRVGDMGFDLGQVGAVRMIAFGKGSLLMAEALQDVVDLMDGLAVTNTTGRAPRPIVTVRAGHPEPDQESLEAGRQALALAHRCGPSDILFVLVSGGGSSLLEDSEIPLEALQEVSRKANLQGMDIRDLNTVRKHLSRIKGGQLASAAAGSGAMVISLVLSDVVGDHLSAIASGPTVPDETTFRNAQEVLERSKLWEEVAPQVRERITAGVRGEIPETPKPGDLLFDRAQSFVVANNKTACDAAVEELGGRGYNVLHLTSELTGEARDAGRYLVSTASKILESGMPIPAPAAVVAGGETQVRVMGAGRGGRNQELALAAAEPLDGAEIVLLSCGTDGRDGLTEAAGAVVDGETLSRAAQLEMDPLHFLSSNDSNTFFRRLGDIVMTGPTGTNVNDIQVLLVKSPSGN